MRYPVNEIYISQNFTKIHRGIDLGYFDDKNQPIYSVCDAKVIDIQKQPNGGNVIITRVRAGAILKNYCCYYGHLKTGSILVKVGDFIKEGQKIALMGNTGKVSGYHLHFGIYKGAKINYNVDMWIDPKKYLCVFKNQKVYKRTEQTYSLNYSKVASGIPTTEIGDAMYIRHKNKEIVGRIYNGDEVAYYGTTRYLPSLTKLAVVDNILDYTTLNKYLK